MLRPSSVKGRTTVYMTVVNPQDERFTKVAEKGMLAGLEPRVAHGAVKIPEMMMGVDDWQVRVHVGS